jgi:serine/threonine protein kinase
MTWEELSVYMRMVLRALDALHRQNMIHRDISPDNIFLTKDGRAKLIDFGSLRSYNNSQGLTTILKHNFAPYEQYRSNGNQGPWTDIYALCVTMYYALGGVLPPKAPDRIMSDKTVPLNQLCPQLPEYVANAVMKGMAVFAEERFQNVEELYQQLYPNEVSQNRQPAQNQQPMQNRQPAQNQQPMQSRQSMQSRQPERWLRCVEGVNRGRQWRVSPGFVLQAGRDARCQINYPADTRGISRCQCSITMDANGHIYIKDENSSYGTFLNQTKLVPGRWYEYYPGTVILFAQERFVFG